MFPLLAFLILLVIGWAAIAYASIATEHIWPHGQWEFDKYFYAAMFWYPALLLAYIFITDYLFY